MPPYAFTAGVNCRKLKERKDLLMNTNNIFDVDTNVNTSAITPVPVTLALNVTTATGQQGRQKTLAFPIKDTGLFMILRATFHRMILQ